jgi:vacuolar-type H+-ATPase subunit C/Vma6
MDLLAVWQLPSPAVIRRLRHAMSGFLQTGDIAILEAALDGSFGDSIADFVSGARSADSLASLLHEDVDRLNLIGALRHHQAGEEVTLADPFVAMAGGGVSEQLWAELVEVDDRADVGAKLDGLLPVTCRGPLAAWVEHGELWVLERELDDAATEAGIARFRLGDPLGIDVPLGFIIRKEAEARNLRLVGRAIVHDLAREDMFDRLIGVR